MSPRLRLLLASSCVAVLSCNNTPTPDGRCTTGFLGDASKPVEVEPIYIGEDGKIHEAGACGPIDIVKPPQGGRVLFVGVRATNLDGCGAKIDAALRDPQTRGILGSEIRTFNLLPQGGRAGWGQSGGSGDLADTGFADFANMTMCPNVNARDVQRQDGLLEVIVTDKSGRKGMASVHVIPRCNQLDPTSKAECECSCEANYTMPKCINVTSWPAVEDAGMCPEAIPDAGTDAGLDASSDGGAKDAAIGDGA